MHEHVRRFDSNADDPRQQFDHRLRSVLGANFSARS